jgi:hypothetical protein
MYQVTKVAENNVEVRYSREVVTADSAKIKDSKVEAFVDPPEVYGETRVTEELAKLAAEKERINSFDAKAELAKLKEKEDILLEIQAQLSPS